MQHLLPAMLPLKKARQHSLHVTQHLLSNYCNYFLTGAGDDIRSFKKRRMKIPNIDEILLQLKDFSNDDLGMVSSIIKEAFAHVQPVFTKPGYVDFFWHCATTVPGWISNVVLANAEAESAGSKKLLDLWKSTTINKEIEDSILFHAKDESRHSHLFVKLVSMAFPGSNANGELVGIRTNLTKIKKSDLVKDDVSLSDNTLLDHLIQMNMGEIRTLIHMHFLGPVIFALTLADSKEKVSSILQGLANDEVVGSIRRGQKGYPGIWWATIEDKERIITIDETEQHPVFHVPKTHIVFNIEQAHGINFPQVEKLFRGHTQKIQSCDKIINEMYDHPCIKHGGDKAFYQLSTDSITIPVIEQFHSDEAYYKTLFHELAHSTGHEKRLNRKELLEYDGFGNENYSKEELTAELSAAFLCAVCEIEQETISNSAAYIKGWLKALRDDKRLILKAAAQAQAAADFILNNVTKNNKEILEETANH